MGGYYLCKSHKTGTITAACLCPTDLCSKWRPRNYFVILSRQNSINDDLSHKIFRGNPRKFSILFNFYFSRPFTLSWKNGNFRLFWDWEIGENSVFPPAFTTSQIRKPIKSYTELRDLDYCIETADSWSYTPKYQTAGLSIQLIQHQVHLYLSILSLSL